MNPVNITDSNQTILLSQWEQNQLSCRRHKCLSVIILLLIITLSILFGITLMEIRRINGHKFIESENYKNNTILTKKLTELQEKESKIKNSFRPKTI
jgi:hypothetical protein